MKKLAVLALGLFLAACGETPTVTEVPTPEVAGQLTLDGTGLLVSIDIKPQSCPNAFNVDSRGVIPVAILGTEAFDVSEVDPTSLYLEGVSPLRWDLKDVSTPVANGETCTEEGGDGFMDLVLHFDAAELAAALGGVLDGDVVTPLLTGQLTDGTSIVGEDHLLIIKRDGETLPATEVLSLPDDGFEAVALGFTFPYQGQQWDEVFVNSNGSLTFGGGETDFSESVTEFLARRPRIAALWDDLNPTAGGSVSVSRRLVEGKVKAITIRFADVPEFPAVGANTFSMVLEDNGRFEVAYGDLTATDGLVGVTEGGGAYGPGETDLSEARGALSSSGTTYELFTGDLDLQGATLSFDRKAPPTNTSLPDLEVLPLGDDASAVVPLGFTFEFQGMAWDRVYVNSNGNLTFGSGDNDFSESVGEFLAGPPRIAAFWDDLNPAGGGQVTVERIRNRGGKIKDLTVSFVSVPRFPSSGANTFSITLRTGGEYEILYGSLTAVDALVGTTEGGGAVDPGESDLSTFAGSLPALGTTYERFVGDFDLGGLVLVFSPPE